MKVFVTGGSECGSEAAIRGVLDRTHGKRPITVLFHSGRAGTEDICRRWAIARGVPHAAIPALAETGDTAQIVMESLKLDTAIVFPGVEITERLTAFAINAGVRVWWPADRTRTESQVIKEASLFRFVRALAEYCTKLEQLMALVFVADLAFRHSHEGEMLYADDWAHFSSVVAKVKIRIHQKEGQMVDSLLRTPAYITDKSVASGANA